MMNRGILLVFLALLSSCVASHVPEEPSFTLDLSGNYQALSDCSYLAIRAKFTDWSKVELPSQKKSQLLFGSDSAQIGTIDFFDRGANQTHVEAKVWQQIHGKDYWPSRLQPIIEACAQQ